MTESSVTESIMVGNKRCRNRIIRSAVHSFLGTEDGFMTSAEYDMYHQLAVSGIGLIITGHCAVSCKGRANDNQTNLFSDVYIESLAQAAKAVHEAGALFAVQLSHAGPRAVGVDDLADVSARPLKKHREARELAVEEIAAIEQNFIMAAKRAQKAGADAVQLHAAHSYLLSRFLDRTFNQREDEYGGSAEHRFSIVENIIKGIKNSCGESFPVLVKINSDSKTDDADYEKDLLFMLRRMKVLGVALVEFSGVDFINQRRGTTLYYLERAARLRRQVDMMMSLVGGVRSLADMEKVLSKGLDMVSLGRPFICEPDFLMRVLSDQKKLSDCVSCNRCFVLPHLHPGMRCVRRCQVHRAAGQSR